MEDQRYRVVIGLSISKDEQPGFNDNGIVYHRMPYDMMVEVQDIFSRHADEFLIGSKAMIEELNAVGVEEAKKRTGKDPSELVAQARGRREQR